MKKTAKASHKLFKATLATTVAAGAFVAAVPTETSAAVTFTDVKPGVHYYSPVLELANRGVVKGYNDGTYRPNASVTRAQAAKILAHVLELDTVNVKNPGFVDVKPTDANYGPIAALAQGGYIQGYTENGVKSFKPNSNLRRSQMAKILTLGFALDQSPLAADRFKDVKPADAYAGYVAALLDLNITTGTTPTTFAPNGLVTRGQMATFVVRTEVALKDDSTPKDTAGDELLKTAIQAELSDVNQSTDAIYIALRDKTFNVTVKTPTSTIAEFGDVMKPVFDTLKANAVVNNATVSIMIGGQEIKAEAKDIDNTLDFETVFSKVLAKAGLPSTTPLSLLDGKTIKLVVDGAIKSEPFNSTYEFKF
ncbi:S-layer homology domain-containing protein [Sporosarcina sp. P13]|uniref:S-layer homology domain-containing protein n=1 Tax=Sporosarcina sp. P13 TaxID=2048263 RepID=UPI0013044B10|nr:S-layer homology domain-containing protein [Sporosarcina sp. P13]